MDSGRDSVFGCRKNQNRRLLYSIYNRQLLTGLACELANSLHLRLAC